jgi:hypothetical protein
VHSRAQSRDRLTSFSTLAFRFCSPSWTRRAWANDRDGKVHKADQVIRCADIFGLGHNAHSALSAPIAATLRGLVTRLNLPPFSDGIILLVLLLFQLLDRPHVPLLVLHDLPLQNTLLLLSY